MRAFPWCVAVMAAGLVASAAQEAKMLKIELSAQQVVAKGNSWSVKVMVRFTNEGKKPFSLDKVTAALDGSLSNAVFKVAGAEGEVEYRGEMAKRAHPGKNGFTRIAPGASVSTVVDLGGAYAFPPEGGEFTVAFSSFNHFSDDAVQLESAPVRVVLRRP